MHGEGEWARMVRDGGYGASLHTCRRVADVVLELLAAAEAKGRAEALEQAATVADAWERYSSRTPCEHTDDPCCHVRTASEIAGRIRALAAAAPETEKAKP